MKQIVFLTLFTVFFNQCSAMLEKQQKTTKEEDNSKNLNKVRAFLVSRSRISSEGSSGRKQNSPQVLRASKKTSSKSKLRSSGKYRSPKPEEIQELLARNPSDELKRKYRNRLVSTKGTK